MTTDNTPAPADSRSDGDELRDKIDDLFIEAKYNSFNSQYYLTTKSIDKIEQLIRRRELESQLKVLTYCYEHDWMGDQSASIKDKMQSIALNVQDSIKELQAELDKLTEGRGE